MRVSVLMAPGTLAVEERPTPVPGAQQVLVRVASVGVCGSDVHYYKHGRIGSYVIESPLILGHEASGTIVAVGDDVRCLETGRRVSIEPGVPDFTCDQCLAGRYNLCPQMRFFATPPIDGAFAEFVLVHEQFAHPVPDSLSDDAGALLEPLSVGVWACRKAQVTAGQRVLVTGAGPVGLLAAQAAMSFGATDVTITDVNDFRLDVAARLGVPQVHNVGDTSLKEAGLEVDVLLECSGQPEATREAMSVMARAGRVVLVGMGADTAPLPVSRIQEYELSVTGTFRYVGTWPTAIALASSGQVALEPLVTGHYSLDDVEDALSVADSDPRILKPIVRPNG